MCARAWAEVILTDSAVLVPFVMADDRIASDGQNAEHYAAPPPPPGVALAHEGGLDPLSMAKLRVLDKSAGRN